MLELYTDGAHSSSTNYGGWAVVYTINNTLNSHSGFEYDTTNNRMELTAIIMALQIIRARPYDAVIYTDSAYISNCFAQKWYEKWRKNNWKTSKKTDVLNQDLWQQILKLYEELNTYVSVQIKKVDGHAGNKLNELADYYAVQARIQGAKENDKRE